MIISMLMAMITTPLVLKFLDKEEYGLSTILFQIVSYLSLLDFGLGAAVSRFLATTRGNDEDAQHNMNKIISTAFYIYTALGVLVLIIGLSFAPMIPRFFDMKPELHGVAVSIGYTLSIFIALQFPLKVFSSIFFAHQRLVLSNTMSFIVNMLNQILPIVFLAFGLGLWSFVMTNIIGTLISVTVTLILLRKFYPYLRIRIKLFDRELVRKLFSFGFYMFLNVIAVYLIMFTDRFFIGTLVSLSVVTMYMLTAKIPEICRDLIFRITDNTYPALVEISEKENRDRFVRVHQKLLLITTACVMVAAFMILILNEWFMELWVGASFFAGTEILLLTLGLMILHCILHVSSVCLNSAGIVKGFTLVSVVEAAFNVGLTFWLGKMYGIQGILWATIIASALTSLWYVPRTAVKYMNISMMDYLWKPLLLPLFAVGSFGTLVYMASNYLMKGMPVTWINLIAIGTVTGLLFALFIWFAFLKKEIVEFMPDSIKRKLLYL
ncbi:oligosaccharide flippase family protein [Paracnuella aquatica]|uniref:oligosaccharide flippase family protein n=1 Tax=Paracnuella aquatica TaxID=2268757 RepID=UPI00138F9EF6|nr:oligosaccharide flippase family protein [Paracnuella aquatica]